MPENNLIVSAVINGVHVDGLRVMQSRFRGKCLETDQWYNAGDQIAWIPSNKLNVDDQKKVFRSGKVWPGITVKWPMPGSMQQQATTTAEKTAPDPKKQFVPFDPNPNQLDIYSCLVNTEDHMLIRALAGSGKTSTLVWLCRTLVEKEILGNRRAIYLAFNTSIKDELVEKLSGTGIPARTTHSFGFSALTKHFGGKVNVSTSKSGCVKSAFDDLVCRENGLPTTKEGRWEARKTEENRMRGAVIELVGYVKNWAILPTRDYKGEWEFTDQARAQIANLIVVYEIELPEGITAGQVIDFTIRTILANLPNSGAIRTIDFDDMLWLPLVLNLKFEAYDLILTDESQDFNTCQHMMLERMVKVSNARAIVVGDPNQSLYGFRGADPRSFDRIADILKATGRKLTEPKLPINYRCDKSIIVQGQTWVPDLQGAMKATGTVEDINFFPALDRVNNDDRDISLPDGENDALRSLPVSGKTQVSFAFLCRINLPLIVTAYQLIGQKKRVTIIGRTQIGAPLINIIEALCGTNPKDPAYTDLISDEIDPITGNIIQQGLLNRLDNYYKIQAAKLAEEKYENKLEALQQNIECIQFIAENVKDNSVLSILNEINTLFADEPTPGVISLSTVHRAKGLEWDVVFILRPELLPHPSAKTLDEKQQERNCCYVACTRARHRLYYIEDWPFGNGKKPASIRKTEPAKEAEKPVIQPIKVNDPYPSPYLSGLDNDKELDDDGLPF